MKITKQQLKKIILEEVRHVITELDEADVASDPVAGSGGPGVGQYNARQLNKILAILTKAFPEHASAGE